MRRVIRTIEYVGPGDWIEKTLAKSIHGKMRMGDRWVKELLVTSEEIPVRTLTRHQQNQANNQIKITVLDEPGHGGACHDYRFDIPDGDNWILCFQNGPIAEAGVNGITHEALLAVLIDRMEGFQSGQYAHPKNAEALALLESALQALQERTRERMERGVEGTHEV